jgi:hypothetical protein
VRVAVEAGDRELDLHNIHVHHASIKIIIDISLNPVH